MICLEIELLFETDIYYEGALFGWKDNIWAGKNKRKFREIFLKKKFPRNLVGTLDGHLGGNR
jgi:hypothetical protein